MSFPDLYVRTYAERNNEYRSQEKDERIEILEKRVEDLIRTHEILINNIIRAAEERKTFVIHHSPHRLFVSAAFPRQSSKRSARKKVSDN